MSEKLNALKQEWGEEHYTTVKVTVKHETAAGFKAVCTAAGASMESVLGSFMDKYTGTPQECTPTRISVSSLRDRRKAMAMVNAMITEIRNAEEDYLNNTPESLQSTSRYDEADERLGKLDEAIEAIGDIYA